MHRRPCASHAPGLLPACRQHSDTVPLACHTGTLAWNYPRVVSSEVRTQARRETPMPTEHQHAIPENRELRAVHECEALKRDGQPCLRYVATVLDRKSVV